MAQPTSTPFNRYQRGHTDINPYVAASGYQINQGDLCCFASGLLYSVTNYAQVVVGWQSGAELQNWSGARQQFAGVALGQQNSYFTTSGVVPCYVIGTFSYPFVATSGTAVQPGSWVNFTQADPNNVGNSGYFAPQALMVSSGQSTGIGRVVEVVSPTASGVGNLVVELQATLVEGTIGIL